MKNSKSKVIILRTNPKTILNDYSALLSFAKYEKILPKKNKTIVKLNLSWTKYFPACSTAPWQLEGVLAPLKKANYDILAVENQTVVTHPWKGAYYNKWLPILNKYDVKFQPLTDVDWISYAPTSEMLAMYDIFDEIKIPNIFIGSNMIHLPTIKTHGHTITTGAIKNAFGGLIPKYRHHAHKKIHEVIVDLLAIQQEIHPGLFAVMDGAVCGNGAGPRTMMPFSGNIILASKDQVAIDAIAAKMMGFNPLNIDYIRMAHDRGLGTGDIDQIDIVGIDKQDFDKINFEFEVKKSPIVKWDQIIRKKTSDNKMLHKFLFQSPFFKSFIFASELYYDYMWYPTIGRSRISKFIKTDWGKLFMQYPFGGFPKNIELKKWNMY